MPQRNTSDDLSTGRHSLRATFRAFAPALTLCLTGLTVACADGPTAPGAAPTTAAAATQAFVPGPHFSVAPATITVGTVAPTTAMAQDVVASFTVQPTGTTIAAPGGLTTVTFPSGFVTRPTTFTITRKAGRVVGYDFQPSGTFNKPVTVTVKLGLLAWVADAMDLQGVYVRDWSQVNATTGVATANEVVPTTVDPVHGTVTMTLSHFSGYLMSTGRR